MLDLMMNFITQYQVNLLFRMIVAGVCGIAIGFERKNRAKEAGVRTHCIVAVASALMMIISKYGFEDLVAGVVYPNADVRLDPSRMAQGIVTGVGFLGSGMIYIQRGSIKGLTTAAGIWATSGIGMALGAGMYAIGVISTLLILLTQVLLHTKNRFMQSHKTKILKIHSVSEDGYKEFITSELAQLKISVGDMSINKNDNGTMDYAFCVEIPDNVEEEALLKSINYKCSINFTS